MIIWTYNDKNSYYAIDMVIFGGVYLWGGTK